MLNFNFYNPARIVFGRGVEEQTGELVKKYGTKVLLHYGSGSVKRTGVLDKVKKSLDAAGVSYIELGGVKPNPRLSLVREGIELCKREGVDFILAVGGGSTIDSSKGIAAGVLYDGDIWDLYLYPDRQPEKALPVGVVLTIPAAGSESSNASVVTNEDGWMKRDICDECIIPRFAIMNPEFTFTLPPYQTGCGASDILAHMMERYFTQVDHVDFTDRLLEGAMRTVINNAPIVINEPENYDARAEIMWAGSLAHNGLLNTGREGDWASHEIEHELSGIYDIAHGAGLSIIFPAWMRYVWRDNPARFVQFAQRVFDVDLAQAETEAIVNEMIYRLEAWYRRIGMPTRFSEAGLDDTHIEEMAKKCMINRECTGHFRKLVEEDVVAIYRLAL
ncbi:MAG: iron-containing alcohol dehydrogenase [Clostridia bacterium]|nr:iron-containing alcohol dehydrogenase [Clostridia bacterium]